jgi:hypothetical protein
MSLECVGAGPNEESFHPIITAVLAAEEVQQDAVITTMLKSPKLVALAASTA